MKYFLSCIFTLVLLIPVYTEAQVSCRPVTAQTYSFCCGTAAGTTNDLDCRLYRNGAAGTSTQTTNNASTTPAPTVNANQCAKPTNSNYQYCCNLMRFDNVTACMAYDASIKGTISSNASPGINPVNTSAQQSVIAPTPVAGAAELKQCSKIKFLSLLDILIWVKCVINVAIIPMLFALATLFFLWGVLKFIRSSDTKNRDEAQKTIWAGLIGLFVMVSLWGIISIFSTMFGTGSTVPLLQTTYLKQ